MIYIKIEGVFWTRHYDIVRANFTVVYSEFLEEEMQEDINVPSYIHDLQVWEYARMYLEKKWNESKV